MTHNTDSGQPASQEDPRDRLIRQAIAMIQDEDLVHWTRGHDLVTLDALRYALIDDGALVAAVKKMHAAKGRYHSQQATCDLYELVGLPCVRP